MTVDLARTRFDSTLGLADLPWFEREGDARLKIVDPDIGPIVDAHTHLALAFGRRLRLDLTAEHPKTEHYLPVTRPLDLDIYVNQNFLPEDLSRLKLDLTLKSLTGKGMRRTHTSANLRREMADLGVRASVLLPIDFPILSHNTDAYLVAAQHGDGKGLIPFGSVHPSEKKAAAHLADQKARGIRGIKLHPAVQLFLADSPKAMALYPICAELGLPVLFHAGPVGIEAKRSRECSQMKHYWRAVSENPQTTFILGHSGALQMEMALELAIRYPNCWLETSSQSLSNVRRILREGPTDRVMHGSDWPFYHQAISVAKLLLATEGDPGLRKRVLWENAARLLGLGG